MAAKRSSGLRFGSWFGLGIPDRRQSAEFRIPISVLTAVSVAVAVSVAGCATARSRQIALLKDRVTKLKPLSTYKPTLCRVSVALTAPALARYKEMFPKEKIGEMEFTWRARESSCEVTAADKSAVTANYKSFLDTSLCLLMQTHWVNSPFDEFPFAEDRLSETETEVVLASGPKTEAGLVLDKKDFVVKTRTKARGTFSARYAESGGEWLPVKLEQDSAQGVRIIADEFEWSGERVNGRRMPSSFTIFAGEQEPHRHSTLSIRDCRAD